MAQACLSCVQALSGQQLCEAIVIWFDVEFSQRFCPQKPVALSTSPMTDQTHWAQTVLPLRYMYVEQNRFRKQGANFIFLKLIAAPAVGNAQS